tara:strand:+ start:142 stop:582 length:441 start_codon:yes stop_codon:yes gene_type:complete
MVRHVKKIALVPYSASEMFKLVDDIEAYPQFLPWCTSAEVLDRTSNRVEATLELTKGNATKAFSTRNTLIADTSIAIELLGGPFRCLSGGWCFDLLGDEGCKVTLDLEFEFENRVVDMMIGSFFEETCKSLVNAFTDRAEQVYGPR